MEKGIFLGAGMLMWLTNETPDRYGSVILLGEDVYGKTITESHTHIEEVKGLDGNPGKLVCEVMETRKSTHTGDKNHGFYPTTPNVGDIIELGEGLLFYKAVAKKYFCIGLRPMLDRERFWLEPKQLFKVHEQTVKLFFIPSGG